MTARNTIAVDKDNMLSTCPPYAVIEHCVLSPADVFVPEMLDRKCVESPSFRNDMFDVWSRTVISDDHLEVSKRLSGTTCKNEAEIFRFVVD